MLGYWNNADGHARGHRRRRAGCTPATWPRWTSEGYVNIVGRIKDMIIRGGENIYPREIEEFLHTPPRRQRRAGHRRAQREATARRSWPGSRCSEGADDSPTKLAAFCRGRIATYKIPRYWKFVDEFPMTVTGKMQKFRMRETAVEELELSGAAAVKTA